jgi:hypothetical protein
MPLAAIAEETTPAELPGWPKHTINDRSPFEAVGVADFNGDGRPDVFSGDSWYAAPQWTPYRVREVAVSPNPRYREDFADAPLDVNGDGHTDIVTCAYFTKKVAWLEHPGDPEQPWTEHAIGTPGSMETGYLLDLYGDGNPVFLPNPAGQVGWYELAAQNGQVHWKHRQLTPEGSGHGVGHGDVNSDGRVDILTPHGWYEQPATRDADWPFHREFSLGVASIAIHGHDFDGDGDTDIVWGMGHDYGLLWLRQGTDASGRRTWTRAEIDMSFSQVHTLALADFDGDGTLEFATGKRIYAHEGEPGATDAACVYLFRFDRRADRWIREVIYQGEGAPFAPLNVEQRDALRDFRRGTAGTGLQMAAADLDGDGDLDLVAPGKSGLYWFENPQVSQPAP